MSSTPTARVRGLAALLQRIVAQHRAPALASAFGAESMVLIDLIARHALPIAIFTLDTGRLPQETYELMDRVRERYRLPIEIYSPDAQTVEAFVRAHGVNAFYRSVELRQRCCAIRKTAPLARALAGRDAWITGLRRAQSVTRSDLVVEAFDAEHGLAKFNPMADWSEDDVWSYIRRHDVPTNPLHALGYPSIGCSPCTRAIEPGEGIRAGRWWWEQPENKECGLHRRPIAVTVREERVGAAS
jgi:phosphoadenosine phosphosulfate reductase